MKSIERLAFYQCKKLQSVSIPGGVKNISEYAFSHCESLTSLTLGEGIETIDREAFACCYNLASIIIPSSMRYIVKYAFWSCNNVNYAKFEDTTTWLITGDVNYSNLQLVDVENEDMKQIIYNLIKKVYYWYKIG